jgi:deoxyribonuclease-4
MLPNNILLGSNVSFKSPKYFYSAIEEAINNGENCFMFCFGSPQTSIKPDVKKCFIKEGLELLKANNINMDNVIIHASYLINIANSDSAKFEFAKKFLQTEIDNANYIGIKSLVLHPGSNINKIEGIINITKALNNIKINNLKILIETMSGKGNEIGTDLNELKMIFDGINDKENIGFCLDTCHLNDSGVDIGKFSDYLEEFDKVIGIKYIKCVHLNDSLNVISSKKDRHANIGYGKIGFDNLINVLLNEKLKNIPKILETPAYGKNNESYKDEIKMIKSGSFYD